jgi:nucleoside-diphosphate-sugar epimerase
MKKWPATPIAGRRVMLVGGAGFIGHNLALALAEQHAEVMVIDNLVVNNLPAYLAETDIEPVRQRLYRNFLLDRFDMMRDAGIELRATDARQFGDLARLFDEFQPDRVVHLAAIASAVEARKDPGLCFDLQLVTLRNVLELCRPRSTEIMFLSSSTVYGDFLTPTVDESVRPSPRGIYANAKYMGERLVRTYAYQHGVPVTIVRPSALYGERCVSRRVSQVFIENALSGKPLFLEGGGDGRLDFTYIHDLISGMIRALEVDKSENYSNTFNLTLGNARTIAELAAIVRSIVPDVVVEERPRAEDKPQRGTLSTDRARMELDFEPKWTLETGYRRYCEWYADQWARAQSKVN